MSDGIGDDLPASHPVSRTLDLLDVAMEALLAVDKLEAITKEENTDLARIAANIETFYQKFGERALSEIGFDKIKTVSGNKTLH
jgi:hypothetical protein